MTAKTRTDAKPRFLQIHTLHAYPATLLNRDEQGMAKRMSYGGHARTRISSQCRKRHWRNADDPWALQHIEGIETALRSRDTINRRVIDPLRQDPDLNGDTLDTIATQLNLAVYGAKAHTIKDRQALLLGFPEVRWLQGHARDIAQACGDDVKAATEQVQVLFSPNAPDSHNFRAFRATTPLAAGIESALFGRMVTADPKANVSAAVHVTHAFTVHEEETEPDHYSTTDDLLAADDNAPTAHLGLSEVNSSLYYEYVVVDLRLLVSNLEGVPESRYDDTPSPLAAKVVEHLVHLIATVSPGSRKGATAPYSFADFALLELGNRQPRTLGGAFRKPVQPQVDAAVKRIADTLDQCDAAYGAHERRAYLCTDPDLTIKKATRLPMDELARFPEQNLTA